MMNSAANPTQTAQRLNTVANNMQLQNNNNIPQYELTDEVEVDDPKNLMEQHKKDYENFFKDNEQFGLTTDQIIDDPVSDSNSNIDDELYKKKKYVPVALVLSTETEYHDFFRQILLAMFDMIRVPPEMHQLPTQLKPCGAIQHKQRIIESR